MSRGGGLVTKSAREPAAPALDPGETADLHVLLGSGFDHSVLAMLLVDENVRTVCANTSAGMLFGTEPSTLVGHRNSDFAPVER